MAVGNWRKLYRSLDNFMALILKTIMENTFKIQFSKSALTALTVMDESVQNTVLASIMSAISHDLSASNLQLTSNNGDQSCYNLQIDNSFRVTLKFEENSILVKNIISNEMIDFFQKERMHVL